jgi:TRAP-type mannitol/chloroaromatic compound transport system permease large subunit
MVYVILLAKLKPALAPPLSAEARRVTLPPALATLAARVPGRALPALVRSALGGSRLAGEPRAYVLRQLGVALLPAVLFVVVAGLAYQSAVAPLATPAARARRQRRRPARGGR